jgi:hypothetical protein
MGTDHETVIVVATCKPFHAEVRLAFRGAQASDRRQVKTLKQMLDESLSLCDSAPLRETSSASPQSPRPGSARCPSPEVPA